MTSSDVDLTALKAAARKDAFARRKAAFDADKSAGFPAVAAAAAMVEAQITGHSGAIGGYIPIRSELSPLPLMSKLAAQRPVGVPVILGKARPLIFHRWTPDVAMIEGPFGVAVPAEADPVHPAVLIVPLVAFDRQGGRLGYGGGFYDRTIAELQAQGPLLALGFAYAAQEAESLPREVTDMPLDAVVTEREVIST